VAGNLGYCGLDRRRSPLSGDEIRACWEPASAVPGSVESPTIAAAAPPPAIAVGVLGADRRLEFIEVGGAPPVVVRRLDEAPTAGIPVGPDAQGWSLFGDLDG
jgi:hypothetical protein